MKIKKPFHVLWLKSQSLFWGFQRTGRNQQINSSLKAGDFSRVFIKELFTFSDIKTEHSKLWHYSYFLKVLKNIAFYLSFISFIVLIIYQKTYISSKTGFHYPSVIKMPPSGQYTLLSNITLSLLLIALFVFVQLFFIVVDYQFKYNYQNYFSIGLTPSRNSK